MQSKIACVCVCAVSFHNDDMLAAAGTRNAAVGVGWMCCSIRVTVKQTETYLRVDANRQMDVAAAVKACQPAHHMQKQRATRHALMCSKPT
jgi:hypothetical protein